jgi:hypothetical protein
MPHYAVVPRFFATMTSVAAGRKASHLKKPMYLDQLIPRCDRTYSQTKPFAPE